MVEKRWLPVVNFEGRLEDVSLAEWIGQAVGAASMCWEDVAKAGVFDSTQAGIISDSLHRHVQEVIDGVIEGTRRAMAEESYRKAKRDFFAEAYGVNEEEPQTNRADQSPTGRLAMAEVPLMNQPMPRGVFTLTDHVPHRGSNVEVWLKQYRDQASKNNSSLYILDDLLESYREHGDTGTPLSQRVVGPHGEES